MPGCWLLSLSGRAIALLSSESGQQLNLGNGCHGHGVLDVAVRSGKRLGFSHGHVEDSVTVAPKDRRRINCRDCRLSLREKAFFRGEAVILS